MTQFNIEKGIAPIRPDDSALSRHNILTSALGRMLPGS